MKAPIERQHDDVVHARVLEQHYTMVNSRKHDRRCVGSDNTHRVGIEGNGDNGNPGGAADIVLAMT